MRSLNWMLSAALFFALTACGKKTQKSESTATPELPAAESSFSLNSLRPTQHCRPVTEIEGDNFQFFWAIPTPGQIKKISFDRQKKGVKVEHQGQRAPFVSRFEEKESEALSTELGSLHFAPLKLSFPNTVSGTIRGQRKEYAVAHLTQEDQSLGYFLCPVSMSP